MVTADPFVESRMQFGNTAPRLSAVLHHSTGAHVLLVEDNAAVGESLGEHLRREGYLVTWVQDGFQALATIEAETPAAVIMDLMLPRMSGTASTRQIRREHPDLPVIGISGSANNNMIEEFLAAGGSTFIDKRHLSPQLFDLLRSLLRDDA